MTAEQLRPPFSVSTIFCGVNSAVGGTKICLISSMSVAPEISSFVCAFSTVIVLSLISVAVSSIVAVSTAGTFTSVIPSARLVKPVVNAANPATIRHSTYFLSFMPNFFIMLRFIIPLLNANRLRPELAVQRPSRCLGAAFPLSKKTKFKNSICQRCVLCRKKVKLS